MTTFLGSGVRSVRYPIYNLRHDTHLWELILIQKGMSFVYP